MWLSKSQQPSNPKKKPGAQLRNLTTKQNDAFRFQELFGDYQNLKPKLILVLFFLYVTEVIKVASFSSQDSTSYTHKKVSLYPFFIIGGILYGLVFHPMFKNPTERLRKVQYCLMVLGMLLVCMYIAARVIIFYDQPFDEFGNNKALAVEAGHIISTGIYSSLLTEAINPLWPLKCLMPITYSVSLFIVSYQEDSYSHLKIWVRLISSILNIVLISWFKSYFRRKLFEKKVEGDDWNKIHGLILNKVPSPIAVLDIEGNIVYNNKEFTNLTKNSFDSLLKNLVYLKKRRTEEDIEEFEKNHDFADRMEALGLLSSPKALYSTRTKSLYPDNTESLGEVLEKARSMLQERKVNEEDYTIFDGKLLNAGGPDKVALYEVTISFMVDLQRIILILRDTTQQAKIISLENNNEYKDKLLATISHEFRTPLNGNLSLVEAAIRHESIPIELKNQFLVPAHRSGRLLLHLINDILDYSHIAVGKFRLNLEQASLYETLRGAYRLLEIQAKSKGLDFQMILDEKLSTFTTDHMRVKQIVLNLLSNAIKFTFHGSVILKAKCVTPVHTEIIVKDTGIGIKQDDLSKLFKEFTRIDDEYHEDGRGAGLGLVIADKLARRLGGNCFQPGIQVKSVHNKGSTFSFVIMDINRDLIFDGLTMPEPILERIEDETEEKQETSEPRGMSEESLTLPDLERKMKSYSKDNSSRKARFLSTPKQRRRSTHYRSAIKSPKKRLLVIDDEPFNVLAIESLLKSPDIVIDKAFNGKEAIEKICELNKLAPGIPCYDLIFMDFQMPILGGYETTKILRRMMENEELADIPIVGCTAFDASEKIEACYEAGMDEVIRKPLSKQKLDQIMKEYFE